MIFVFDLDGTICFKGEPLSHEICAALDTCILLGDEVVFASARPIRDLLPVLPKRYYHFRMVGGNGAFIRQEEQTICATFDSDTMTQLKAIVNKYQLTYLFDSDWEYSYTGSLDQPIYQGLDPLNLAENKPLHELETISKVVLFTDDVEVHQSVSTLPVTIFHHHAERLIDISPLAINKAAGLKVLGIDEYIAFGNDQNDLELFNDAAYSICVGNHPVCQFVDEITTPEEVAQKIIEMAQKYKQVHS